MKSKRKTKKKKELTFTIEVSDKFIRKGNAAGYRVYVRVYDPDAVKKLKRVQVEGIILPNRDAWDKSEMRVSPAISNSIDMTKRILDTMERVKRENGSLVNFLNYWLAERRESKSIAYQNRIQKLINKIAGFLKHSHRSNLTLAEVDYKFLDNFYNYLSCQPVRKNESRTLSKKAIVDYFKVFKTILRDAEKRGEFRDNPFTLEESKKFTRDVNERVIVKESLTTEELKAIENLGLFGKYEIARDMFLFSFYSCGMRFEDCLTISWNCVKDGYLTYKMIKNGKAVKLEITREIQRILDKYRNKNGKYVFPLLKNDYGEQTGIRNLPKDKAVDFNKEKSWMNTMVNRYLKAIANGAGITKNLSFHIARHTFASLYDASFGIEAAQQVLHHSNLRTTKMYLDKGIKDDEIKHDTRTFYHQLATALEEHHECMNDGKDTTGKTNSFMKVIINPKFSSVGSSQI